MPDAALRALLDRREIHDVVLRYCRGIDRLDLEAVHDCYLPGAIDRHTGFSGPRDEFVEWVARALARFDGTLHVVANHLSEVDGDRALAETYGLAYHWGTPAEDRTRNFVSAFRYVDRLERHGGRWAIRERDAVREWTRALSADGWMRKEGAGPTAVRGGDDPVYSAGFARGSGG